MDVSHITVEVVEKEKTGKQRTDRGPKPFGPDYDTKILEKLLDEKILVDRPKALGDIRGVTYIYGMFYQFGLIDVLMA